MSWILLIIAGLFETAFAIALKASHGFTKVTPTVLFIIFSLLSFTLLSIALKKLPVGTAYAVWTGIGTVGTALFGILIFSETAAALRLASILLIVLGIVGLRVAQ